MKRIKLIISDLHLGSGSRRGEVNTREDFYQDEKFYEFINFYSSGEFENHDVELIINGDFMDLLKVKFQGKFVEEITEIVALDKVRKVVEGHPLVFKALSLFISKPNRGIVYIIGNHDFDIAFEIVQNFLMDVIGEGKHRDKIKFITDKDTYKLQGGIHVCHGHQFEAMNRIDYTNLKVKNKNNEDILNLPWGATFVLKVLAPLKEERPIIDLVKPLSQFIFYGLIFDIRFTLKVLLRMVYYFLKTRFFPRRAAEGGLWKTLQIVFEELKIYGDIEGIIQRFLEKSDTIQTLIMGHSHLPKIRRLKKDKLFINTGTWVKMISLDFRDIGTKTILTYGYVEYNEKSPPEVKLMRWRGKMKEFEEIYY